MEKLVPMTKNHSTPHTERGGQSSRASSSRECRNSIPERTGHGSRGEASSPPNGSFACAGADDRSNELPYAQVHVTVPRLRAQSPTGAAGAVKEEVTKSTFFQRLTARARRHASHPELDHDQPATVHVNANDGRRENGKSGVTGGPHLRESRSLDSVLEPSGGFFDGCDAVVFINNATEPHCRLVSLADCAGPATYMESPKKAVGGRSRNSVREGDNADGIIVNSESDGESTGDAGDDVLPPAIPARLYDSDDLLQIEPSPPVSPPRRSSPEQAASEPFVQKSKLLQDMLALTKCKYYWGPIDEDAAAGELSGLAEGTFIVHDSQDTHHLYAVSVVLDEAVRHFLIDSFDDQSGYTFNNPAMRTAVHPTPDDIEWNTLQSTVPELIEWAQHLTSRARHRRGLRPYLIRPLYHPYVVPSLQDMCRTFLCKDMKVSRKQIRFLPLPRIMQDYLLSYGYFAA